MTDSKLIASSVPAPRRQPQEAGASSVSDGTCSECLGSGGWFRYEPALDPAPGQLYLSCLQCRGTGRMAEPRLG